MNDITGTPSFESNRRQDLSDLGAESHGGELPPR